MWSENRGDPWSRVSLHGNVMGIRKKMWSENRGDPWSRVALNGNVKDKFHTKRNMV